jgi:hypothetical protein
VRSRFPASSLLLAITTWRASIRGFANRSRPNEIQSRDLAHGVEDDQQARGAAARDDDLDDIEALVARSAYSDDLGAKAVSEIRSRALALLELRLHQARPDGVSRVLALINLTRAIELEIPQNAATVREAT